MVLYDSPRSPHLGESGVVVAVDEQNNLSLTITRITGTTVVTGEKLAQLLIACLEDKEGYNLICRVA